MEPIEEYRSSYGSEDQSRGNFEVSYNSNPVNITGDNRGKILQLS